MIVGFSLLQQICRLWFAIEQKPPLSAVDTFIAIAKYDILYTMLNAYLPYK